MQPLRSKRDSKASKASPRRWKTLSQQSLSVQIQATTYLTLKLRRDQQGRPSIYGRLRDDHGKPIPRVPLTMRLPNRQTRKLRTGPRGGYTLLAMGLPTKGAYTITFPGKASYASTSRRRMLDLGRVDLTLQASGPPLLAAHSDRFEIQASLSFQDKPLARYPLTLFLLQRKTSPDAKPSMVQTPLHTDSTPSQRLPLMTFHTDTKGALRFVWSGKPLQGPGEIPLLVRYGGDSFFLPQEKALKITILAPPKKPTSTPLWLGLVLGLVVVGGILAAAARRGFPNKLAAQQALPVLALPELPPMVETTFSPQQVGAAPPSDFAIAGQMLDAYENTPIAGVSFYLEESHEEHDPQALTRADREGRFFWEADEGNARRLQLSCEHPHYQTRSIELQVPHHGQNRALRVFMYSYRYLIFELLRKAVYTLAPGRNFNPRRMTVREILSRLPKETRDELRPLASLFEEAYYASQMPKEKMYQKAIELLQEIADKQKSA